MSQNILEIKDNPFNKNFTESFLKDSFELNYMRPSDGKWTIFLSRFFFYHREYVVVGRGHDETMKRWNDETMKRVGPEIDNETNLFMILVRLRRTYAFTLHKAMLSWRHEHSSKTASTTSQGYPPSRLDATFRIRTDHICKFLRHPFHLSTLKRSFLKTMPFQNAPILKLFSKVSVFINVFGCFRVDDRQKHVKRFVFSNENAEVW